MDHFPYQSHRIKACSVFFGRSRSLFRILRKHLEEIPRGGTIEKFFLSDFYVSAKILQGSKTERTVSLISAMSACLSNLFPLKWITPNASEITHMGHIRISELMKKRKRASRRTRDGKYSRETLLLSCSLKKDDPCKTMRTGKARDASIFV